MSRTPKNSDISTMLQKVYKDAAKREKAQAKKSKIISETYAVYNDYFIWVFGKDIDGNVWVMDVNNDVCFPLNKKEQKKINYITKKEAREAGFGLFTVSKITLDGETVDFNMPRTNDIMRSKWIRNHDNKILENFEAALSKVYSNVENITVKVESTDYNDHSFDWRWNVEEFTNALDRVVLEEEVNQQHEMSEETKQLAEHRNKLENLMKTEEKEFPKTGFLSRFRKWLKRS